MSREIDPTVHRRRLRTALRTLREAAGYTQRDVAQAMDWSLSKLIRIETGVVSISTNDLRALLAHYRVDDEERVRSLLDTARAARQRSMWSTYSDIVSPEFGAYLAHEATASVIRGFQPLLVPGLVQTPDYARAIITATTVRPNEEKISGMLELRLARQELLLGEGDPKIFFILDEAVIRRIVGSPAITRGQLRYLRELALSGTVSLLIVPFRAGMYGLLRWPTLLLEFDHPDDASLLYIERPEGEMLVREGEQHRQELGSPATYLESFWEVENLALDYAPAEMIDEAIRALEDVG